MLIPKAKNQTDALSPQPESAISTIQWLSIQREFLLFLCLASWLETDINFPLISRSSEGEYLNALVGRCIILTRARRTGYPSLKGWFEMFIDISWYNMVDDGIHFIMNEQTA